MYLLSEKWKQKGWTIGEADSIVFLMHDADKIVLMLLMSEIDWWWDKHRISRIDQVLESQATKCIVQAVNTYMCPN